MRTSQRVKKATKEEHLKRGEVQGEHETSVWARNHARESGPRSLLIVLAIKKCAGPELLLTADYTCNSG